MAHLIIPHSDTRPNTSKSRAMTTGQYGCTMENDSTHAYVVQTMFASNERRSQIMCEMLLLEVEVKLM